jgi:hypothetical protein
MARNTGKNPPDSPLPEKDRRELLDELSSVQDMLNEDDTSETADDEPPVLKPDSSREDSGSDGEEQMPLLQPDGGEPGSDPANERLRKALSERPNPFLSDAARNTDPQNRKASAPGEEQPNAQPENPEPTATGGNVSADTAGLSEQQMRALVDETLAAWLPRIERELRDKLMERLRNQQG